MKSTWKLQDAKNQFSKIVQNALSEGPQWVTCRGEKAVVILSVKSYNELLGNRPQFNEFLLKCPKVDQGLDLDRV